MIDYAVANLPIPDFFLRTGSRILIRNTAKKLNDEFQDQEKIRLFSESLKQMPIAIQEVKANEQHYEVPDEFYQIVLGKHLKYSCCLWDNAKTLDEAEVKMLEDYIQKADIQNGQTILDLGCGWGSFSLFAAQKFPESQFYALSNSKTQKNYIEKRCKKLGIENLEIITDNIVTAQLPENKFDRIVSIEMLEHMKNYQQLFAKISKGLKDDGLFFAHIFSHHKGAYHFEVKDESDWITKYFFEGGTMPSDRLFYEFQDSLNIKDHWVLNGKHYQKTANAWLKNMDENRDRIIPLFEQTYGKDNAKKWFRYWRLFFIAVEELWRYDDGKEWIVSHYLFSKQA